MIEVHYGVVQIEDQWMVISEGLRWGPFDTRAEAEHLAHRMADQAAGLDVQIHLQDETGELHRETHPGAD